MFIDDMIEDTISRMNSGVYRELQGDTAAWLTGQHFTILIYNNPNMMGKAVPVFMDEV